MSSLNNSHEILNNSQNLNISHLNPDTFPSDNTNDEDHVGVQIIQEQQEPEFNNFSRFDVKLALEHIEDKDGLPVKVMKETTIPCFDRRDPDFIHVMNGYLYHRVSDITDESIVAMSFDSKFRTKNSRSKYAKAKVVVNSVETLIEVELFQAIVVDTLFEDAYQHEEKLNSDELDTCSKNYLKALHKCHEHLDKVKTALNMFHCLRDELKRIQPNGFSYGILRAQGTDGPILNPRNIFGLIERSRKVEGDKVLTYYISSMLDENVISDEMVLESINEVLNNKNYQLSLSLDTYYKKEVIQMIAQKLIINCEPMSIGQCLGFELLIDSSSIMSILTRMAFSSLNGHSMFTLNFSTLAQAFFVSDVQPYHVIFRAPGTLGKTIKSKFGYSPKKKTDQPMRRRGPISGFVVEENETD